MPSNKKLLQAAAGSAGGDNLYVEDVFSTYLYTGNSSTQTINNGIDLDGEGGLVWHKRRTSTGENHYLYDTERGVAKALQSNQTNAEGATGTGGLTSFNSNGYTYGTAQETGQDYVGWTFRKAKKFFDVVTYTGTGSTTTVSHNLGSTPGFIIVKRTSLAEDWTCYHVGVPGAANYIQLNKTDAYASNSSVFNNTAPTDSVFTVGSSDRTNTLGETYVAYLFASDAGGFGDDDENIIKCGSYTGNGSSSGPTIDLGFEPQFVIIKAATNYTSGNWLMLDTMRGWTANSGNQTGLYANLSDAEIAANSGLSPTATGFQIRDTTPQINGSGNTYIYIAIRRPMKTPEAGTEVFAIDSLGGTAPNPPGFNGILVDWAWKRVINTTDDWYSQSRLTGTSELKLNATDSESTADTSIKFDYQDGWLDSSGTLSTQLSWMFKRATGFMDVVATTGASGVLTLNHNLGVPPEFLISKRRNGTGHWYADQVVNYLRLNTDGGNLGTPVFNNFTATTFNADAGTFSSGETYITYLFATLDGVSKVGSYTGTNTTNNIDCGFSSSARFILIKRSDSSGDWYFWDSARGITVGNDPYLTLNTTAAQLYPGSDVIQPYSSGFTLTNNAGSGINGNGGTYIFLAIA